jgi:hypothetical protein
MKPKELEKNLHPLGKHDLYIILLFVFYRWLRYKVARLHPSRLIIPITLAQITLLIVTVLYSTNIFIHFAIGNLTIVAIALIPTAITQKRKAFHWVKHE